MNYILIISDIHDWHSKRIKFELQKLNYSVKLIKFDDLIVKLFKSKDIIFYKQKPIKIRAVWVRFISNGTLEELTFKLSILHILRDSKIYVHNSAEIIEKTVDKSRTSMILKLNKINTPSTWIFNKKNKNNFERNYLFNSPLIVKPLFGSQGKGIRVLKKAEDFLDLKPCGNIYYIQEFLGELSSKVFSDFRILVSNHKAIYGIERSSKNYITNVCLGAKIRKIKIDKELKKICEKISKIFDLGYGGIDIKIYKKKIYVLEVNSIPSWKGLQSVEKQNITKILVDDFITLISKK